jgi:hypothetical protein
MNCGDKALLLLPFAPGTNAATYRVNKTLTQQLPQTTAPPTINHDKGLHWLRLHIATVSSASISTILGSQAIFRSQCSAVSKRLWSRIRPSQRISRISSTLNAVGPRARLTLNRPGYFVNDLGQIRMINAPDKQYVFHSTNNDRVNEVLREAMQSKCNPSLECSRLTCPSLSAQGD